ncbi:hypothetical protein HMPREF0004_3741 [Achromobacter piechaudii ATCC 43553]|uniref:Uncharacterized protein n=1 Tax=Achromobacter piechaudii ATCC 43553 TaxID=742159 RepID=D4XE44_9BURK|nr:hypothetical protein HMPREF0004_3741 [Achromobacter piechaudii ATCC 43553]
MLEAPDEEEALEELDAADAPDDDVPVLAHAVKLAIRRKGISLRIM